MVHSSVTVPHRSADWAESNGGRGCDCFSIRRLRCEPRASAMCSATCDGLLLRPENIQAFDISAERFTRSGARYGVIFNAS